jgi:outer membrane lipoprotein-sorting protein
MIRLILPIWLLLLPALSLASVIQDSVAQAEVEEIIRRVDRLYRSQTSYSELEMEIITPHWQRTLAMYCWSKGMEETFIRITSPQKEKGVATLRVGNEMWNYLPKTNKVIKIPPSMMMGSWMGSDFTNDDLVKESSLFEDYSYELIPPDSTEEGVLLVNCIPREDLAVVWGNIVIAVSESDLLPRWQKYYDEKGVLMRVMTYSRVMKLGGRRIPSVIEMVPQNKEGHRTVFRYLKVEFDTALDDETFTLRNLRSHE